MYIKIFTLLFIVYLPIKSEAATERLSSIFFEYSNSGKLWEGSEIRSKLDNSGQLSDLKYESFILGLTSDASKMFGDDIQNITFQGALRLEQYRFKSRNNEHRLIKTVSVGTNIPAALEGGFRYHFSQYFSTGLLAYVYGIDLSGPSKHFEKRDNLEIILPLALYLPLISDLSLQLTYRLSTDISIDGAKNFEQQNTLHIGIHYKI